MRSLRLVPAVTLALLLCACGGGGGGVGSTPTPTPSPTPTPTPTPPPGAANADLVKPLVSETFVNDAAVVNADYTRTDNTTSVGRQTLSISYNATTDSYAVSGGGLSQAFGPSSRDPALSSGEADVYVKKSGNTTDSLSISKNSADQGTPTSPQYRYVGGGVWQHTVQTTSGASGFADAFTYGVATPSDSLVRTGAGNYLVQLRGVAAFGDVVAGVRGDGKLAVDFASGAVGGSGQLYTILPDGSASMDSVWHTTATLSSTANQFSGSFGMAPTGTLDMSGGINGRFYGPSAEEVGAAWYWKDTFLGTAYAGYMLGKDEMLFPSNTDLAHLLVNEDFPAFGWVYKQYKNTTTGEYFGMGEPDPHPDQTPSIGYSETNPGYVLNTTGVDGAIRLDSAHRDAATSDATFDVYTVTQNNIIGAQPQTYKVKVLKPGAGNPLIALSYTSFAQWTRTQADRTPYAWVDEGYVAFGMATPADRIPVAGTGTYSALVYGQTAAFSSTPPMNIRGDAQLVFDFAGGSLDGYMHPIAISRTDGTQYDLGQYDFALTNYSVGSTVFSGEFANHLGQGSSSFNGQFMGPNAQEIAARWESWFAIPSTGAGGKMFGIWVGRDPTR